MEGAYGCDKVADSSARRPEGVRVVLFPGCYSQVSLQIIETRLQCWVRLDRCSGIIPRSRLPALTPKPVTPAKFDLQRSSSAHKPLNIEDTRETPTTTPGHTNGTVKMVRGRSRFLDDAGCLLCGKRRNGMAGAIGRRPRQSQICCRSTSIS